MGHDWIKISSFPVCHFFFFFSLPVVCFGLRIARQSIQMEISKRLVANFQPKRKRHKKERRLLHIGAPFMSGGFRLSQTESAHCFT
jgi:hypothetical protein